MSEFLAGAEIDVDAPADRVWTALTDPDEIAKYMFGAVVETDWRPGSPIVWKGEYEGKPYEDKGTVLAFEPVRRLQVTHFSAMSGQEDLPENYHTVTYDLDERDGVTHVSLTQDGSGSQDEADRSSAMWATMLGGIKDLVAPTG
jgi:uncharacterized protein YndB with AHSA1/START domain